MKRICLIIAAALFLLAASLSAALAADPVTAEVVEIAKYGNLKLSITGGELLEHGYAYGDVRNVRSSLSQKAGEAFLEAYGAVNVQEKYLDDVIAPIVALNMACRKENFPRWAEAVLQEALTDVKIKIRRTLEES